MKKQKFKIGDLVMIVDECDPGCSICQSFAGQLGEVVGYYDYKRSSCCCEMNNTDVDFGGGRSFFSERKLFKIGRV